jgi:hypothetical protein
VNEPTEEELEAQIERAKVLCFKVLEVLEGAADADARSALAAAIAQKSFVNENPDRSFLESIDAAFAVFREISNTKYRNEDRAVS